MTPGGGSILISAQKTLELLSCLQIYAIIGIHAAEWLDGYLWGIFQSVFGS